MIKQFNYKQFGSIDLAVYCKTAESTNSIEDHIKIIFIPAHYGIKIDFEEFHLEHDALLFVNPKVVVQPLNTDASGSELIHFNKDFYCIEIHDQEVACDGILYNNVFEVPFIELDKNQSTEIRKLIAEVKSEMQSHDNSTEEMLRVLLKLIILKSTRIWKQQHQLTEDGQYSDVQFLRKFSKLVEANFRTHHTVADYADILAITPKSLSKKIGLLSKESPNDIIKNRIILESKRLLAYTSLSVKEIAYSLNYDDDAYFVRFFTKNTGTSPTSFRKQL